jgi:hypothetical protein
MAPLDSVRQERSAAVHPFIKTVFFIRGGKGPSDVDSMRKTRKNVIQRNPAPATLINSLPSVPEEPIAVAEPQSPLPLFFAAPGQQQQYEEFDFAGPPNFIKTVFFIRGGKGPSDVDSMRKPRKNVIQRNSAPAQLVISLSSVPEEPTIVVETPSQIDEPLTDIVTSISSSASMEESSRLVESKKKAFAKWLLNLVKSEVLKFESVEGEIMLPSHYYTSTTTEKDLTPKNPNTDDDVQITWYEQMAWDEQVNRDAATPFQDSPVHDELPIEMTRDAATLTQDMSIVDEQMIRDAATLVQDSPVIDTSIPDQDSPVDDKQMIGDAATSVQDSSDDEQMIGDPATPVQDSSSVDDEQMDVCSLPKDEPVPSDVPSAASSVNKRWFPTIDDFLVEVKDRKKPLPPPTPTDQKLPVVAEKNQEHKKDAKKKEKAKKGKNKIKIKEK